MHPTTTTQFALPTTPPARHERRLRRNDSLADALHLQLDVCREREDLVAIVVSDELGFCVAHAGGDGDHADLAAYLPMLADPTRRLRSADTDEPLAPAPELTVTTFHAGGSTLHACTVAKGAAHEGRDQAVLEQVTSGFIRMLA